MYTYRISLFSKSSIRLLHCMIFVVPLHLHIYRRRRRLLVSENWSVQHFTKSMLMFISEVTEQSQAVVEEAWALLTTKSIGGGLGCDSRAFLSSRRTSSVLRRSASKWFVPMRMACLQAPRSLAAVCHVLWSISARVRERFSWSLKRCLGPLAVYYLLSAPHGG